MADTKISNLTDGGELQNTDSLPAVRSGSNVKVVINRVKSINGLSAEEQGLATGTAGTDFTVTSSGDTHTFDLPDASTTARGVVTTGAQTLAGVKTFQNAIRFPLQTLTDGATITPDFAYQNFEVQLGGARTLANPTNLGEGQSGTIMVFQDNTGSRTLTPAANSWYNPTTAINLSTLKGSGDQVVYNVTKYATGTATMTIATPCVVTWTNHGLYSGEKVTFATTGALPTGVTAGTLYWVNVIDANTFNLSTSLAYYQAGTYVATSGSQSGTHTVTSANIVLVSNNLGAGN